MSISIDRLDHLVLTVSDIEATCAFYRLILSMDEVEFSGGRKALKFGTQKINLHQAGREFDPKARRPTPGSADICLISTDSMDAIIAHLRNCGVHIEVGRVERIGATGAIVSVYFRDPDGNLVEVSKYPD